MPTDKSERRIIYLERKERGYCPRCGIKKKKTEKYIYCDNCRAFFRKYNKENSESINEKRKNRYNQRIERKKCPRCGKYLNKKYEKKKCPKCLEKQYKYNYGEARLKKRKEKLDSKKEKPIKRRYIKKVKNA